jgi:chemosensory pili system protein ChpC
MNTLQSVRSLLIPLSSGWLLLPGAMVAEVIPFRAPDQPNREENWFQGLFQWREQTIPLISFEKVAHLEQPAHFDNPRIIICYGIKNAKKLPFYGIKTPSIPLSVNVNENTLKSPLPISEEHHGLSASVIVVNKTAWLPDIDYIEKLLIER